MTSNAVADIMAMNLAERLRDASAGPVTPAMLRERLAGAYDAARADTIKDAIGVSRDDDDKRVNVRFPADLLKL